MTTLALPARTPIWLPIAAGLGILWNTYGAWQFLASFAQTEASLMAAGMTQAQAALYLALPVWISVVFALGVFGGLAGSVALLLKKAVAQPIFAASLAGYILLFAGDAWHGVFANIPSQLAILAVVVVIAVVLFGLTLFAKRRDLLA